MGDPSDEGKVVGCNSLYVAAIPITLLPMPSIHPVLVSPTNLHPSLRRSPGEGVQLTCTPVALLNHCNLASTPNEELVCLTSLLLLT